MRRRREDLEPIDLSQDVLDVLLFQRHILDQEVKDTAVDNQLLKHAGVSRYRDNKRIGPVLGHADGHRPILTEDDDQVDALLVADGGGRGGDRLGDLAVGVRVRALLDTIAGMLLVAGVAELRLEADLGSQGTSLPRLPATSSR